MCSSSLDLEIHHPKKARQFWGFEDGHFMWTAPYLPPFKWMAALAWEFPLFLVKTLWAFGEEHGRTIHVHLPSCNFSDQLTSGLWALFGVPGATKPDPRARRRLQVRGPTRGGEAEFGEARSLINIPIYSK